MKTISVKHAALVRRHRRVRQRIFGTAARPRVALFRSLKHMTAQLIDDDAGRTLLAVSDQTLKTKGTKTERATALGTLFGTKAKEAKITHVVFDRGGRQYHGRIQAFADGARQAGLTF